MLDVLKARIEEGPELDGGCHRNFQNIHVCAIELWLGLLGPLHWNMEAWGSVGRLVRTSHVWERNTAASSVTKHPPAALLVSSLLWSHGRFQQALPWDETGEADRLTWILDWMASCNSCLLSFRVGKAEIMTIDPCFQKKKEKRIFS